MALSPLEAYERFLSERGMDISVTPRESSALAARALESVLQEAGALESSDTLAASMKAIFQVLAERRHRHVYSLMPGPRQRSELVTAARTATAHVQLTEARSMRAVDRVSKGWGIASLSKSVSRAGTTSFRDNRRAPDAADVLLPTVSEMRLIEAAQTRAAEAEFPNLGITAAAAFRAMPSRLKLVDLHKIMQSARRPGAAR